jgi:hypothetical protein
MASYHHIAYKNEFWESLTRRKATTKRNTLSHPLTRLNQKSCPKIPSNYDSHKSPVLILNLEFNHLLEILESYLPLWYFEFPQFSHRFRLKPQISQVARSVQKLEFHRHPQFSEIIAPESLVGLRVMGIHQKDEKDFYDVGIEGFLRLHWNWGQKFRFLRMLNSVQNKISAARPTLKTHNC